MRFDLFKHVYYHARYSIEFHHFVNDELKYIKKLFGLLCRVMLKKNEYLMRAIVHEFDKLRDKKGFHKYDMGAAMEGVQTIKKKDKPGHTQRWKRVLGEVGDKPQPIDMENYLNLCDFLKIDPGAFIIEVRVRVGGAANE